MKYRSTPIKSMLFFILMCLLLAGFTNMGGSSAGYKASKPTKTPTPSRTPTRTPTATRTQTPSPTITNTPPPTGTPFVCLTWSLASDFRISPNQENPNRDSCNNLGVWKFMGSTDLTPNPANYFLLPNFNPAAAGVQGLNKWYGASSDGHISFNASGSTYISGSITWPANTIDVHPGPARMVVMAWQSPLTGFVSITGGVNDNNPFMGNCNAQDGIRWYLDRNTTSLASGVIANGGAQAFADGTGGQELNTVAVNTGDMIYLAIHPDSNYYCDDTGVNLTISATSSPTDTPTPTTTFTPSPTVTPTSTVTYTPTITPTPNSIGSGICWESGSSWPGYSVYFSIDRNTIPVSFGWDTTLKQAAQTWTDVTPSHFEFIFQEGGNNPIKYEEPNDNTKLAAALTSPESGPYSSAYIKINPLYQWDTNIPPANGYYNLLAVVTHEFGHWLKLQDIEHPYCSDATMYYAVDDDTSSLSLFDINGINYQYP